MSVAEQAVSLFAANEGYLDDIPVNKVQDFEAAMQDFIKAEYGDFLAQINETCNYNDEIAARLREAIEKFKSTHTW